MTPTPLKIEDPGPGEVSGLWQSPAQPSVCLALAHGAGAGMTHRSMIAIADGLEGLGVATLPVPVHGEGRQTTRRPWGGAGHVRAAVAEARVRADGLPLFAGGRSFGGRMTPQAQSLEPLPGVRGLAFFAFWPHPAGKPSVTRAEHLAEIGIPMLFLQGSKRRSGRARSHQGDSGRAARPGHAESDRRCRPRLPRARENGRKDPEVLATARSTAAAWMAACA